MFGFTKIHLKFLYISYSVRRTQVIDDESDYFSTDNRWLSKTEKAKLKKREEELRAQRHASRKDRKITLDFAGRQVIEESNTAGMNMYDVNDDVIQEIHYGAKSKAPPTQPGNHTDLVNPSINVPGPKVGGEEKKGVKTILNIVIFILKNILFFKGLDGCVHV